MNRWNPARNVLLLLLFLACTHLWAETWYVRPDGGTRYSKDAPSGQCDGKSDAAYPGRGTHQHCAFKDVQYLWQDGSKTSYFHRGWIIAGGDTVIIRGSIADKVSYRIGWQNSTGPCAGDGFPCFGFPDSAADSGSPYNNFPSGSPGHPTRLLGGNYGNCSAQSARTQLHGGYGVYSVLDFRKASNIDVECLDITDFSACGRGVGQDRSCEKGDDYASYGIRLNNAINHAKFADIRIHGMAVSGMVGAVGDDVTFTDWAVVGNAGSGWDADDGSKTTGSGNLLVQNFEISWNGCSEEYPMVDRLPYNNCTDDQSGTHGGKSPGYGDGFGTTTITGSVAWHIKFEDGLVSYNTQDGIDALHASGAGSTTTADRVLAYGNMGNQIKIGSDGGSTITNNVVYNNCDAMRSAIPGTPAGYNRMLSDFCRAGNEAIIISMNDGSTSTVAGNTIYGSRTGTRDYSTGDLGGIICAGHCTNADKIIYADNILVGFDPHKTGRLPGKYYFQEGVFPSNPFINSGSVYSNNLSYHVSTPCPDKGETHAICAAPQLKDINWKSFGYSNVRPSPSSNVIRAGIALPGVTHDYTGAKRGNPPSIGAYEQAGGRESSAAPEQEQALQPDPPAEANNQQPQSAIARAEEPIWACCGLGAAAGLLLIYRGKKRKSLRKLQ